MLLLETAKLVASLLAVVVRSSLPHLYRRNCADGRNGPDGDCVKVVQALDQAYAVFVHCHAVDDGVVWEEGAADEGLLPRLFREEAVLRSVSRRAC